MPQISLYIDENTLKKVENAALRRHMSLSKWVVEQIRRQVAPIYPKEFENLFGSITDETFMEPIEINRYVDIERFDL
ncbi:MAG: hypothetical protein AAB300_04435 [Nitrospirota bacterium]